MSFSADTRQQSFWTGGVSESYIIFSSDEGEIWSKPVALPPTLVGDKHIAKYAPEGRLVIAFRDMDFNSPPRGHFIIRIGSYEDLKNCRTGDYRVKLRHNYIGLDCAYAGLELLPDGTFVTNTCGQDRAYVRANGRQEHSVLGYRFRLEEFDRLLKQL